MLKLKTITLYPTILLKFEDHCMYKKADWSYSFMIIIHTSGTLHKSLLRVVVEFIIAILIEEEKFFYL